MAASKLIFNSKTEFMMFGTPQKRKKFEWLKTMKLRGSLAKLADSAQNLGVFFASTMSLINFVNAICKSSHMHIRDLRRIKRHIPIFTLRYLANALV